MTKLEVAEKFASMWKRSRMDAGKSQVYMAKALGVSKKTVQAWEEGTSCPSQLKGFEWFQALGLQPLPYYLEIIYPEFDMHHTQEEDIDMVLMSVIRDLPTSYRRKLLYALSGVHGSSVFGIIDLMCAHLQTPLRDRLNIAQSVATNYEIASSCGKLRCENHVQPDMDLLYRAIGNGKDAVLEGRENYTTEVGDSV